jgi:hypothetical protein
MVFVHDLAVAKQVRLNDSLWMAHAKINSTYSQVVARVSEARSKREARRYRKQWDRFLQTSQGYYATLARNLAGAYGDDELKAAAAAIGLALMPPFVESAAEGGGDGEAEPVSGAASSSAPGATPIPNPNDSTNASGASSNQTDRVQRDQFVDAVYAIVIQMGDLSRYRHAVAPSADLLDQASKLYTIAHEIDPTVGKAQTRLALTAMMQGMDPLRAVYHLFIALQGSSVSRVGGGGGAGGARGISPLSGPSSSSEDPPCEVARKNLLVHFKEMLLPTPSAGGLPSPDPMVGWFLRLHASLFLGRLRPATMAGKHAELENEVLNRLEVAVHGDDARLDVLLMMVVVNVAAYEFAKRDTAETEGEWGGKSMGVSMGGV